MSRQLTLFGKVAASWKAYGNPTNNWKQFVNASLADECRCSPSLSLQQANETNWRMLHGKRPIMARTRWLCQIFCLPCSANDGECARKSFVVPIIKSPSGTKFPSTNSSVLAPGKVRFVFGWGRGEKGHTYVKDITFRK